MHCYLEFTLHCFENLKLVSIRLKKQKTKTKRNKHTYIWPHNFVENRQRVVALSILIKITFCEESKNDTFLSLQNYCNWKSCQPNLVTNYIYNVFYILAEILSWQLLTKIITFYEIISNLTFSETIVLTTFGKQYLVVGSNFVSFKNLPSIFASWDLSNR